MYVCVTHIYENIGNELIDYARFLHLQYTNPLSHFGFQFHLGL